MPLPYFAYGSNLLRERLLARCPNSVALGRATLLEHRLTFDKLSRDHSGKCAYAPARGSEVQGVLWSVSDQELSALDGLEGAGRGYVRDTIRLVRGDGAACDALVYRAANVQPGLKPYDWYLALVTAGARQQDLPARIIESLLRTESVRDPESLRRTRLDAIAALRQAGFLRVVDELER